MTIVNPATKLTYQHYVLFPDDGLRHEILDGVHSMNPAPSTYHQAVSRRIQFQLYEQIERKRLGIVANAPVDVHLGEFDVCQPDLVVVLRENRIVTPTKIKGAPDLIIEIMSPSTVEHDRHLKRARYEQAGVREYWIVDPFEHEVEQLVLDKKGIFTPHAHGPSIPLAILPDVCVNFDDVWTGPLDD